MNENVRLSGNFLLGELTASTIVPDNSPSPGAWKQLHYLANYILQPIRDRCGMMLITSGFRGQRLNSLVGGSPTSQHLLGEAVDFVTHEADLKEVYKWIVEESRIPFGQCIYEEKGDSKWIHISLIRYNRPNNEALLYDGHIYTRYTGTL